MLLIYGILLMAQVTTPSRDNNPFQQGVDLASHGQCSEAMPLLDAVMRDQSSSIEAKRTVSFAGVRCSMLLNQQTDAMSFVSWLQQAFPHDPEVLFLAVRVFSDLSQRNADELMKSAPDSPLVIELNAENFEKQGEYQKAIAEYRILLGRLPDRPGIHYRIGTLMLLLPASPARSEEARREFEAELKISPQSAGAEYYIGELARQANRLPEAVEHLTRATKLNPQFGDAYATLGRALLDSDKTAEAVDPLETAAKLDPDNPTVHFALGTAYRRLGRDKDAAREFALQKSTSGKINETTKTLRKNVAGALVEPGSK